MKCFRKQYYLKNVASSSIIRKIEFDISRVFKNGAIKINPDNNVMMVEFKNCESIEEDIALIMETIKKVDDDIIIEEKEIKPTYRKVLLLENLDCANCAAKIERIAKRTFDHEMIVVDFARPGSSSRRPTRNWSKISWKGSRRSRAASMSISR